MDDQTKLFFGKILGEMYRIQKRVDPTMFGYGDEVIYGLCNGFESVIDAEIDKIGSVTTRQLNSAGAIFTKHWHDPNFKGYYDLEPELTAAGIDRGTAMKILTYFKAENGFVELIEKMNSGHSPTECKTFEL